jgi:hypothetical protein
MNNASVTNNNWHERQATATKRHGKTLILRTANMLKFFLLFFFFGCVMIECSAFGKYISDSKLARVRSS